jgi:hypothetical protein
MKRLFIVITIRSVAFRTTAAAAAIWFLAIRLGGGVTNEWDISMFRIFSDP